MVNTIRYF